MNVVVRLAWRNLWRNKRRTLIASASVFFAVILALVMRSMQEGSYDYMVDASVSMYTGYIQVHAKDYWEKRSIDKSMVLSKEKIEEKGRQRKEKTVGEFRYAEFPGARQSEGEEGQGQVQGPGPTRVGRPRLSRGDQGSEATAGVPAQGVRALDGSAERC